MRGAYYNEWDPKAAAWIRELVKRGLVAPGDVDERSIVDVRPDDLKGYAQCHFFSGIAVWSYALRRAGWTDDRPCWTGSPPCQPFSAAGQQKGVDDERHLAPAWLELIKACRPEIVFGEQVASSLVIGAANKKGNSRGKQIVGTDNAEDETALGQTWLDSLQSELEDARYAFGAIVTNSCSFGAPHIRKRLRFVAKRLDDTASARHVGPLGDAEGLARDEARLRLFGSGSENGGLAFPDGRQRGRLANGEGRIGDGAAAGRQQGDSLLAAGGELFGVEHDSGDRRLERGSEPSRRGAPGGCGVEWLADNQSEQRERESGVKRNGPDARGEGMSLGGCLHLGRVDDDDDARLEGQRLGHSAESGRVAAAGPVAPAGEPSGLADADGGNPRAERQQRGREQRIVTEDGRRGELGFTECEYYGCCKTPDACALPGRCGRGPWKSRDEWDTEFERVEYADSAGPSTGQWNDPPAGHGLPAATAGVADRVAPSNSVGAKRRTGNDAKTGVSSERAGEPEHGADVLERGRANSNGFGDVRGDGLPGDDVRPGPTNGWWGSVDWLFCRDGKWRPVEPGTFPLAHGAPARVGRLRGYGNAVDAEATRIFIKAAVEALDELGAEGLSAVSR